tara:strand:- start:4142 stop:5224 length:1083 start_codon:yes stop_codon:yes gene_type:complete
LKISKINFYPLKSGVVIIEIKSNNGLEGIGQFIGNSYLSQKLYFKERLEKILINKKININEIWNKLYWNGLGKNGWLQVIAAIDIALYDLESKNKKLPLYKFLKIKNKKKISLYWSIGHGFKKTIKEMQSKIEIGLKLGFTAFKIRMDWHELRQDVDPGKDYQMLKAVRSMLPKNFYLGFDANAGYSVKEAIRQGKKFEDLGGISHFEEPIATNDLFGLGEVVKSLKIPISFGEYEKLAIRFKEILAIAKPGIIQPDILNIGGISQMLKLFKFTNNSKTKIMPHSPDIGILCFASLHLAGKYDKDLPHEFSPELYNYNIEKHAKIFNENIIPNNGEMTLDRNSTGIGLTINKKELKKLII